MRVPHAASLLLATLLVAAPATGAEPDCDASDDLDRPAQAGVSGTDYNLTATARVSMLLYGDAAVSFYVTTPPGGLACTVVPCGPSTDACTVDPGAYVVHVYSIDAAPGPFVLLTADCAAPQVPGCAPTG